MNHVRIVITEDENRERIEFLQNLFLNNHRNIELVVASKDIYYVNNVDTRRILNILIIEDKRKDIETMLFVAEALGTENACLLVKRGDDVGDISSIVDAIKYSNQTIANVETFDCFWNKSDCNNRLFRRLKAIVSTWLQ